MPTLREQRAEKTPLGEKKLGGKTPVGKTPRDKTPWSKKSGGTGVSPVTLDKTAFKTFFVVGLIFSPIFPLGLHSLKHSNHHIL